MTEKTEGSWLEKLAGRVRTEGEAAAQKAGVSGEAGAREEAEPLRLSELVAADRANILQTYEPREIALVKGEGSRVFDSEGRSYLDCITGIAVNALGHGHPAIFAAIQDQLGRFAHVGNIFLIGPQQRLAEKLKEATGYDRVFFCNSGTEANEGALKFARKSFAKKGETERFKVVSLSPSFHGRTYGAMAATGQDRIKQGFGPMPAGFESVPVNDIEALDRAVDGNTAAILFEPILAEGGIVAVTPEFAAALARHQEKGVLLIADEIQTGCGRTGDFLGSEALGLRPDIVTLAKPLGGGLPLGAVLLTEKAAEGIEIGDHGTTFGGNPVACAAGGAVLGEILRPGFLGGVKEKSAGFRAALEEVLEEKRRSGKPYGPVLGRGFLTGFFAGGDLGRILKDARAEGLMAYKSAGQVLRLLPPLNISEGDLGEVLAILRKVL